MSLTEKKVKSLIKIETKSIQACLDKFSKDFEEMKKSQKRIERVLLGDKEYEDKGLAYMVNYSYDYVRRNTESDIVERAEDTMKIVCKYKDNGYWTIFEEMVTRYKAIKWFFSFIIAGGLMSTANIIYNIVKLLTA